MKLAGETDGDGSFPFSYAETKKTVPAADLSEAGMGEDTVFGGDGSGVY